MERDQERLLFWVIGMHFGREATEFSFGFATFTSYYCFVTPTFLKQNAYTGVSYNQYNAFVCNQS